MDDIFSKRESAPLLSRGKRLLFALVTLGIAGAFILVFAEVVIRVASPQPASWLAVYQRHPRLPFYSLKPGRSVTVDTGEVRWQLHVDGEGFRATSPAAVSAKTAPVVIGDSFTFGQGVEHAETFVGRLASATGRPWINAGVPGYGPTQYRQILEDLLAQGRRPERVLVVTYLGNDFHDVIWNKDFPIENGIIDDPGGVKSLLKRKLHFYRLLSRVYHVLLPTAGPRRDTMGELYSREAWAGDFLSKGEDKFELEFRRIAKISETHGIPIHAALIPARLSVQANQGEPTAPGVDYSRPTAKAKAILEAVGIPYVDLLDPLRQLGPGVAFYAYDGHFTVEGNRVAAEEMLKLLDE